MSTNLPTTHTGDHAAPLASFVRGQRMTHQAPAYYARPGGLRDATDEQLARVLGWFSIGLGMAEILAPKGLGRLVGAGNLSGVLPLLGVREIVTGLGILSKRRPAGWLWSRVAGDGMDIAFLAAAASSRGASPARLATAAAAVAGVAALDFIAGERLSERPSADGQPRRPSRGVRVRQAITINRPAPDLYHAWHQFENLPQWMTHLQSVERRGENKTRWVANGPAGTTVSWEAETVVDKPNEVIAWRSMEGSRVTTYGGVKFLPAPGNRGTEVTVEMTYDPPGGQLGAVVASIFGRSAEQEIAEDLRRFKRIMEAGEAPQTSGQPRGRCFGLF